MKAGYKIQLFLHSRKTEQNKIWEILNITRVLYSYLSSLATV